MHTKRRRLLLILAALVLVVLAVLVGVFAGAKYFVGQVSAVRTAWRVDVGELLGEDQELELELRHADVESDLTVLQLVPFEVDQEGFTYYDTAVQDRLAQALEKAKAGGQAWEAGAPLAVLNPYGTGNNGLYLYFETDLETQVTYTVHVEGLPDFTATAADQSGQAYSRTHEFQLIGLVPGETNQVTMVISGSWGNVRQQVSFSFTMPETRSGYPTRLDYTDGESGAALSQGLFTMMRTNGYLGYGFFFDNEGVLRYEMVLEGYGLDRILWVDGDMVTCISSTRLARLDGLGRVKRVYDLTGYELHHDIIGGPAGKVIALVDKLDSETIEDVVVEVDLETGAVTELVDFSVLMEAYFWNETHPVPLTGDFFWQAGEWDWLHLNTVEYAGAGEEEGVYYLRLYNNNYWSNSTRDYVPELDESVSESLYGDSGDHSWVYVYRVDENQGTFSLEQSFPVPYSSIVSNAAPAGEDGNWVVNSGISHVYGEYDETGTLIREFSYECTMQGYRTFKHSFAGFWFQA